MSLVDKGPIAPPPLLPEPFQGVSAAVRSWPGVIAATHWHLHRPIEADGADHYVGETELGHIHLDGDVHLATSPRLRRALIEARLARAFPFAGYDEWVLFRIRDAADAAHGEWLFRLAYDLARGCSEDDLMRRVAARAVA